MDARRDAGTLAHPARTDACATQGLRGRRGAPGGLRRLAPTSCLSKLSPPTDEIRALHPPSGWQRRSLMNMVIGGKTPITSAERAATLGYGLVLYANAALQARWQACKRR